MTAIRKRINSTICAVLLAGLAQAGAINAQAQAKYSAPTAQYASGTEARNIIQEIISVIGLKPKFEVRAANVPNAAAVISNGKRYILYNEKFVNSINTASKTDWAGVSILAHEMGHHLNGHTLDGVPNPQLELESDEFSGFILRKLGASLEDAQIAMKLISDERGSRTHPGRADRLVAIEQGWKQADAQSNVAANVKRPNAGGIRPQEQIAQQVQQTLEGTIGKENLLGEVRLATTSGNKFYITKRLNFVRQSQNGVELIGKLKKTNLRDYPYVIESTTFSNLYVTNSGVVVNQRRQRVGMITDVA